MLFNNKIQGILKLNSQIAIEICFYDKNSVYYIRWIVYKGDLFVGRGII